MDSILVQNQMDAKLSENGIQQVWQWGEDLLEKRGEEVGE